MHQPCRPARKNRPVAIVLVLLAHALLVMLFMRFSGTSRYEPEQELVFLSLWPVQRVEREVAPQPTPQQQRTPRTSAAPPPNAPTPPAVPTQTPSTAIDAPVESNAPVESPRPNIDWRAEAAAVAGRHATPTPPPGFAPPPKPLRKPCEKKKSSWEWKEKDYGIAPLPYVKLGKRCVIGLGFFGCALQKPPEANSHLLDDMRDGKTAPSSVPDPYICE